MRANPFVLAVLTSLAVALTGLTGCASADDGSADNLDDESNADATAEALSGAKCTWAEDRASRGLCEPSRHGTRTWLMCPIATDRSVFNDLRSHLGTKNVTRSSQRSGFQIVVSGC
jgi:hypothetical protein